MPRSRACLAASTKRSTLRRSTPGMDSTCVRLFLPSWTNAGQIRSSTERRVSATSLRDQSSRRLRRSRVVGKRPRVVKRFDMGRSYSRSDAGDATAIIGIGSQAAGHIAAEAGCQDEFAQHVHHQRPVCHGAVTDPDPAPIQDPENQACTYNDWRLRYTQEGHDDEYERKQAAEGHCYGVT